MCKVGFGALNQAIASPQDHSSDDQLMVALSSGDVQMSGRLIEGGVGANATLLVSRNHSNFAQR